MAHIDEFVRECIQNSKENGYNPHKLKPDELAWELWDYTDIEDQMPSLTFEELLRSIKRIRQKDDRKKTGDNP